MKAEQFTDVCTYHGEGPIWDSVAGVLRWVDMLNGDVLTMAPDGSIGRQHVGTVAAAMRPGPAAAWSSRSSTASC